MVLKYCARLFGFRNVQSIIGETLILTDLLLNQLRCLLGNVKSILMDHDTLLEFQPQWGREDRQTVHHLPRLNANERVLYDDLRDNKTQMNLRLEQEKIGFRWVEAAIRALDLKTFVVIHRQNPIRMGWR
jgi:hypothetical protein